MAPHWPLLDAAENHRPLVSIILGGFSVWLSLHFYTKTKDAETETKTALASIQAQSDALQRLTGKWMDRFTRHATEPRAADEAVMRLVDNPGRRDLGGFEALHEWSVELGRLAARKGM